MRRTATHPFLVLVPLVALGCSDPEVLTVDRPGGGDAGSELVSEIPAVPGEGVADGGADLPDHCVSGRRDGDETHRDCGGSCTPCPAGAGCDRVDDCISGVCSRGYCLAPSCNDEVRNGEETDIDCGGTCGPCAGGAACETPDDCESSLCDMGTCAATSCTDGSQNDDETDVDCGGSCPPCAADAMCVEPEDCMSQLCIEGVCEASTCEDFVKNGDESDVDCGGPDCMACPVLARCGDGDDCASGVCESDLCQQPSCEDEVPNQDETDVDCGGSCAPCDATESCAVGGDCVSGVCGEDGTCQEPSCDDGVQNGGETDVDCGGDTECARCEDFRLCVEASDCQADACTNDRCGDLGCMPVGSDTFGYFGCSLALPAGTEVPCPDISSTGTDLSLSDDDYEYVAIGFPFEFYGTQYDNVAVQSNGALTFDDSRLSLTNSCLPDEENIIAVMWDDLNPRSSGAVYTELRGTEPMRSFVVQWDVPRFSTNDPGSFTAVLHESGDIQVCYRDAVFDDTSYDFGASATAGIQGPGTDAVQFSCNSPDIVDNLVIDYFAPPASAPD
jgi:hypothetical protein